MCCIVYSKSQEFNKYVCIQAKEVPKLSEELAQPRRQMIKAAQKIAKVCPFRELFVL